MRNKKQLSEAAAVAAATAAETSQNAINDAVAKANELLQEAQRVAGPAIKDARVKSADYAAKRLDDWEPQIRGALDKVTPAVDAAREKVAEEYLPKLQSILHDAAEHPVVQETTKRGKKAAKRALKGELEPKKRTNGFKVFGKIVLIGAAVTGAVAALRHFLTPKDDGWTAHEPSKAYVNNSASAAFTSATPAPAAEAAADSADEDVVTATEEAVEADTGTDEPAPADDSEGYGPGSYVGTTPPEGFHIKGNERSKKFHLPGSGGHERTIAEVWFSSEEAAEAAGFTRAQRQLVSTRRGRRTSAPPAMSGFPPAPLHRVPAQARNAAQPCRRWS
ncbi:MAG: hypothetical protein ACK5KO_05545 [Arachnia sp.]